MTGENGTRERLRQLERRIDLSETDRKEIWRHQGMTEKALAVLDQQLQGARDDLGEVRSQLTWLLRGVWGLVATGALILTQLITSGKIG